MQTKGGYAATAQADRASAATSSDHCHAMPKHAKEILMKPRGVFSVGHPIRMNVVPMFLNVFTPWLVWILCMGIMAFKIHYFQPGLTFLLIMAIICAWFGLCCVAYWARKELPDPTWLTYCAVITLVAIITGTMYGQFLFNTFNMKYYQMSEMKVIAQLDVNKELGKTYMDGGIFYFANGNHIHVEYSWHFTHGTVYCVAPIISGSDNGVVGAAAPATGIYDWWAVGKDCCSTTSADFRCGDFANPQSRSGFRVLDTADLKYYTLAVEQAETMYSIKSQFPIFIHWDRDPLDELLQLSERGNQYERVGLWSFFTFCVCMVFFASFCFGWLGRIPFLTPASTRTFDS